MVDGVNQSQLADRRVIRHAVPQSDPCLVLLTGGTARSVQYFARKAGRLVLPSFARLLVQRRIAENRTLE